MLLVFVMGEAEQPDLTGSLPEARRRPSRHTPCRQAWTSRAHVRGDAQRCAPLCVERVADAVGRLPLAHRPEPGSGAEPIALRVLPPLADFAAGEVISRATRLRPAEVGARALRPGITWHRWPGHDRAPAHFIGSGPAAPAPQPHAAARLRRIPAPATEGGRGDRTCRAGASHIVGDGRRSDCRDRVAAWMIRPVQRLATQMSERAFFMAWRGLFVLAVLDWRHSPSSSRRSRSSWLLYPAALVFIGLVVSVAPTAAPGSHPARIIGPRPRCCVCSAPGGGRAHADRVDHVHLQGVDRDLPLPVRGMRRGCSSTGSGCAHRGAAACRRPTIGPRCAMWCRTSRSDQPRETKMLAAQGQSSRNQDWVGDQIGYYARSSETP